MSGKELFSSDIFLGKLRTGISFSKTSSNFVPILRINNMISQPSGILFKPVLFIPSSRDIVATIRPRYNKSKDEKNEKESNQNGHATEIEGQKSLLVPVSSKEATEGNQEDKNSKNDNRPSKEMDAFVVWFGSQPDAGCYYRD